MNAFAALCQLQQLSVGIVSTRWIHGFGRNEANHVLALHEIKGIETSTIHEHTNLHVQPVTCPQTDYIFKNHCPHTDDSKTSQTTCNKQSILAKSKKISQLP
jgi:hypothetical protein